MIVVIVVVFVVTWLSVAALLVFLPLPDRPPFDPERGRPGDDGQWTGWRDTVPNIRRMALAELSKQESNNDSP